MVMKHFYTAIILSLLVSGTSFTAAAQCTAGFSFTTAGNTATFTDTSSTTTGNIITWAWDFGDGNFDNVQNPVHTYAIAGQYIVTLNIATSAFCFDSFTDTVTVMGGCTASYTYTVDTTNGQADFQAQPLSPNLYYSWDFGDASTGTGAFPSHTYGNSGNYNVCLMITDSMGFCSDTICDTVNVYIAPPNCTTTFTATDQGNGTVWFNVDPFDFNMTYDWQFGDSNTGTGGFTNHTYSSPGTYLVCLDAYDANCSYSYCDTVVLAADTSCPLDFSFFVNDADVTFFITTFNFGSNITYTWDFGDSNSDVGNTVTHTYANNGSYIACVTMVDTYNGCNETMCDTVQITVGMEELGNSISLTSYPNPFNGSTSIQYSIIEAMEMEVAVFDLVGNKVAVLANGKQAAGPHKIEWNAEGVSSGAYLLKVTSEKGAAARLIIKN